MWFGLETIFWIAVIVMAFRLFSSNRTLDARLRVLTEEFQGRLRQLEGRLERLEGGHAIEPAAETRPEPTPVVHAEEVMAPEPPVEVPAAPAATPVWAKAEAKGAGAGPSVSPPSAPALPPAPERRFEWERFIGLRLPVWLGAIALCIAGFFFVKYAIDSGFFTAEMRVLSAAAASLAFLAGAETVRRRMRAGNPAAIASALAAAAIATAYATVFLASRTYGLIPTGFGFIATIAVSGVAIAIALAYGQVVALVGVIGGYVAPIAYGGGEPSPGFLAAYLMALTAVSFTVIRLKSWWRLSVVGLLGPALWGLVWSITPGLYDSAYWGSALLISLPLIVTIASWNGWREDGDILGFRGFTGAITPQRASLVAAVILAAIGFVLFLISADFAIGTWQGLIVYSLLAVGLGFLSPPHRALQLPVGIASGVALLLSPTTDATMAFVVVGLMALVYGFGALDQFRRLREPGMWAGVLSTVALYLFAMALFKVAGWHEALDAKHLWALGALAIAAAFVVLLRTYGPRVANEQERSVVYAAWGGTVTTLVSLVAVLEIDPLYFPGATAVAILGLAAVHLRAPVRGLRTLAAIYLVIYGALIFASWAATGTLYGPYVYVLAPAFEDHSLVLLVLPGIAMLAAATLFQRGAPDDGKTLIAVLDIAGIVALAIGLRYLLLRDADVQFADILTVGWPLAVAEILLAAIVIYTGRRFARPSAYNSGIVLSALVSLGLLGAAVAPIAAFWPPFAVPGAIVFNVALLAYGLPALILFGIGWFLRQDSRRGVMIFGVVQSIFAVVLVYTMVLVDIRQAWHLGAPSLVGETAQSEYYAYSIATLVFGLLLLVFGVAYRNRGARALSFVFVLAATIKVFLFDAAALEGLWRVLSFLLMGLSFLGISWAYARFVFGIGAGRSQAPPAAPPDTPLEAPAP